MPLALMPDMGAMIQLCCSRTLLQTLSPALYFRETCMQTYIALLAQSKLLSIHQAQATKLGNLNNLYRKTAESGYKHYLELYRTSIIYRSCEMSK